MKAFGKKRFLILLGLLFILPFYHTAQALILPPDPFGSTDRYARLVTASDGTITGIKAKVKAPGDPLGPGELRALLQYKLPSPPGHEEMKSAASAPIPIQTLRNSDSVLAQFDFSSLIPAEAYSHTLMVYYQGESRRTPLQIGEYGPDQLLLESVGVPVQIAPPPEGAVLVWGPVTFLRERENPKTEQVSIPLSDAAGPFLLRLSNGTSEGDNRVSSAVIKLNGNEVFRPSEFNRQVAGLSRQVMLVSGENQVEVRLRSAPGAFVTLELFRMEKQACPVYNLHTFIRSTGKPMVETVTFPLSPQFSGPFTLDLSNGNSDVSNRIDSAVITLNGAFVFDPHQFNEQVGTLSQVVSLQSANTLDVELQGAPGDFLGMGITGYDYTPPKVTITSPSNGAIFQASPISINGKVDDISASVTVNETSVPVASDGSFTHDGVVLQEGENIIKVIAADGCGNQGEDQIVVYLQPVSQGPSLQICARPMMPTIATTAAPAGGEDCQSKAYSRGWGLVTGTTDETAVSITLNGVLFPDGVEVVDQEDIQYGIREGTFFWARVRIASIDGSYPFTAVAMNAEGGRTEATVTFIRDMLPPGIAITSPSDGWVTSSPSVAVTGTVDDPEATVRLGWEEPPLPVTNGVFTTLFTLSEGENIVFITAVDPIWNFSYAQITVILDTTQPEINITGPTEGTAVNSPTLNVTGTFSDENMETVIVAANGGSPQSLSLTGTNFSGAVNLTSGPNTLIFTAKDKAGNTTSVTRSVLLDMEPPAVTITSPASGAHVSGTISVTVEAADGLSGIAAVSLLVDGQPAGSLSRPPFIFSVNTLPLADGSHSITVRATDTAGNQGEATISVLVSSFAIEIIFPANGSTVNQSKVLVYGKIYNRTGEVGVVINGVLTEVQGDDFAAILPLQIGQNILTAVATKMDGSQVQTSATLNTDTQQEMIRLTVSPASGILKPPANPLDVSFEAEAYLPHPVSSYAWDFNGDGTPEITGSDSSDSKVTARYQAPGLYFPKVTVTDTQGNVYTETTVVNVFSFEEMDGLLRSKWEWMKSALFDKEVPKSLNYFIGPSKEVYQQAFNIIIDELPGIISDMQDIEAIFLLNNTAKYRINRVHNLDGILQTITYYIYFVKDLDGIWRIDRF